jgi:hypothetical protein
MIAFNYNGFLLPGPLQLDNRKPLRSIFLIGKSRV